MYVLELHDLGDGRQTKRYVVENADEVSGVLRVLLTRHPNCDRIVVSWHSVVLYTVDNKGNRIAG